VPAKFCRCDVSDADVHPPKRDPLTIRDLIVALGWHFFCGDNGPEDEFAAYWHLRFELLSRAFGLPAQWHMDRRRTPGIVKFAAVDARRQGFFSQILEYSPLPGEMTIWKRHKLPIKAAEAVVYERLIDYAEELLLTFWPQLRGKTVSFGHLLEMGLPEDEPAFDPYS